MKKIFVVALSALGLTILAGCNNNGASKDIMISEYIAGSDSNQAIEIYNNSDKEINLADYSIGIYAIKDKAGAPTTKVNLEGTIASKKTFVIVNKSADKELLDKADLKSETLSFGGKEGISLMHKDTDLDVIGSLGIRNQNMNLAFIRKTWMTTPSTKFNLTDDYLYYNPEDAVKYLGEFKNSVTKDDLLAGPKFVEDYLDIDFYEHVTSYTGTGGAVEVTLDGNIDGDTSYFIFPEEAHVNEYMKDLYTRDGLYCGKVRYQEVDTPETQVQNKKVELFGWPAKLNTAKLQDEADHIYVQSNAKQAMVENYGRMLGFVFVVKGNDSTLVNFDTIKHGYSTATLVFNGYIKYLDCPYYNFFVEAEKYAKENKLGLNGEVDPYWDYENNKSKML